MADDKKDANQGVIIAAIIAAIAAIIAAIIGAYAVLVAAGKIPPFYFANLSTATPTSTPTATISPSPSSQPTSVAGKYAPVILDIKTEESGTAGVLYFDIHFRDPDGDSTTVTYNVVSSTIPVSNLTISNYRIPPGLSAQEADSGTVVKDFLPVGIRLLKTR